MTGQFVTGLDLRSWILIFRFLVLFPVFLFLVILVWADAHGFIAISE